MGYTGGACHDRHDPRLESEGIISLAERERERERERENLKRSQGKSR
jgi:hypothetical protein